MLWKENPADWLFIQDFFSISEGSLSEAKALISSLALTLEWLCFQKLLCQVGLTETFLWLLLWTLIMHCLIYVSWLYNRLYLTLYLLLVSHLSAIVVSTLDFRVLLRNISSCKNEDHNNNNAFFLKVRLLLRFMDLMYVKHLVIPAEKHRYLLLLMLLKHNPCYTTPPKLAASLKGFITNELSLVCPVWLFSIFIGLGLPASESFIT